ncbi:hypothetical protein [Fimbriiglobus ruber]|uniref:Uncharacterized protein n=1 Tax=Fimbriiglobus ruber TaxID=1908690 RepID=A0A225DJZ8_9BACT|nr:hypothetical protein [Fimbriiglobus ruber]OWK36467.1 hypothetical protein FRUB_09030 [Fimbriiglobus ruber]
MGWFEVRCPDAPARKSTLICDATPAAAPLWAGPMLSILEAFAERPPPAHPDVVFLGDTVARPIADVLRLAADPDRLAAELGRGAVLGPWAARAAPRPSVVVLNSDTQVLDWADYETPDWAPYLKVYRGFGPVELDAHLEFLDDAPVSLMIQGSNGVFSDWTPAAAEADWDRLSWPAGSELPAVARVEFHHPDGAAPAASLVRRSGLTQPCRVTATARPAAAEFAPVPVAAETILNLWGRGMGWACGLCHASHAPGVARCGAGDGTLFPSLPRDGLWSVRRGAGGRVAVRAGRGRLVTADGDAIRLGAGGAECRRADGSIERPAGLFQRDADGGNVLWT